MPKAVDFIEQSVMIPIEAGSQPFISDLNGDFLEDVLYSEALPPHKLKVALQSRNPEEFLIRDFDQAMLVTDETEGCLQRSSSQGVKKLSIPHTAAQIDFDGDCLSDLFITVQDTTSGKTYYEIYLRRELEQQPLNEDDLNLTDTQIDQSTYKGLNSFCLVTREEVPSQTNNLFSFADIDRDAMVDMLFVTKNDLSLHIYFNKLIN